MDEFFQELSKAMYIPKAGDNLVATREAQVALSVRYLENVRSHRRRDAQSEITYGCINLVQQLSFIGRG